MATPAVMLESHLSPLFKDSSTLLPSIIHVSYLLHHSQQPADTLGSPTPASTVFLRFHISLLLPCLCCCSLALLQFYRSIYWRVLAIIISLLSLLKMCLLRNILKFAKKFQVQDKQYISWSVSEYVADLDLTTLECVLCICFKQRYIPLCPHNQPSTLVTHHVLLILRPRPGLTDCPVMSFTSNARSYAERVVILIWTSSSLFSFFFLCSFGHASLLGRTLRPLDLGPTPTTLEMAAPDTGRLEAGLQGLHQGEGHTRPVHHSHPWTGRLHTLRPLLGHRGSCLCTLPDTSLHQPGL